MNASKALSDHSTQGRWVDTNSFGYEASRESARQGLRSVQLFSQNSETSREDEICRIMAYDIEQHQHRLAAWAAANSASASKLCRFKVHQGVAILEACGFNARFSRVDHLPPPASIDQAHHVWRTNVVAAARAQRLTFTHGVAAKLINCYLKVRFVCAGKHAHERVKCLHPPIDEILLKELARQNFGGNASKWRKFRQARWSKFDSDTYQNVIDLIRASLRPGEPLWTIEEHWVGHQ